MAPRFCLTGWHPKAGALIAPRQYSLPKIARWVCACRATYFSSYKIDYFL